MESGFLGQSYEAISPALGCDRLINLYFEKSKNGLAGYIVCPGWSTAYCTLLAGNEVRGLFSSKSGKLYAVCGKNVYSIVAGVPTLLSTQLTTTSGAVQMTENPSQIIIVDGVFGYLITKTTGLVSKINSPNFPNGTKSVTYQGTYFICPSPDTERFYVSDNNDGTTWNSLDFSSADSAPDNALAVKEYSGDIYIFGLKTVECWANSGNADFPYTRRSGAVFEVGLSAINSISKQDSSLIWLGNDENGTESVWRLQGGQLTPISDPAIEHAIQSYETIDDAIGMAYSDRHHSFYLLCFPTESKVWGFDLSTGLWHERSCFDEGQFTRYAPNCMAFFERKRLFGHYSDGKIYELDHNEHSYGNEVRKWLRAWKLPTSEGKRVRVNALRLTGEFGVGVDGSGQGENPLIELRISYDNGRKWESYLDASMGMIGDTECDVRWNRCGTGRDMTFEVSGTDPVRTYLTNAYIDAVLMRN